MVLLVRVGIPSLRESGVSTLRGKLRDRGFLVVCVSGPFAAWGAKGLLKTSSTTH
jgi:hypothetical protein